jgi:hypothetical protein
MSITAAQRKKDPHAGPGDSFPEDSAHLKAAWDLASHAKDPEAVRAKVLAFARAHGMMDRLPASAKHHDTIQKATAEDLRTVFSNMWNASDDWQHRHMVQVAHDRGLAKHLPHQAHGMLHDMGLSHEHEGMTNQTDDDGNVMGCGHEHMVTKAMPKVGFFNLEKAWGDDGADCFYEGWLSTPTKDLERDITEPEAFVGVIKSYFARRAPVSVQHGTQYLPAGHLQKAVVVRDGNVLATAEHPTDAAEFEHFPGSGSGVWVRGRLTEAPARDSVRKGNCGGMSFIAMASEYTPLYGGGRRITKLSQLQETTVAPYPANPEAAIAVAKAFGLSPAEDHQDKDDKVSVTIEELLAKALEQKQAEETKTSEPQGVTHEELGKLLLDFQAKIESGVEAAVVKSLPVRGEGAGRKGGSTEPRTAAQERDDDPFKYIVKKAVDGSELDEIDQKLIAALTWKALTDGMLDTEEEDDAGIADQLSKILG